MLGFVVKMVTLLIDLVLKSNFKGIFPLMSEFLLWSFSFFFWLESFIPKLWAFLIWTSWGLKLFIVDFLFEDEFFWWRGMNLSGVAMSRSNELFVDFLSFCPLVFSRDEADCLEVNVRI